MGIRESNSFIESSYTDTDDVLDSLKRASLEIKDTKLRNSVLQICIDKFNIGNLDGAITTMKDAIAQYKESVPPKNTQTINDIIYGIFDNETGGYLVANRYPPVTYSDIFRLFE